MWGDEGLGRSTPTMSFPCKRESSAPRQLCKRQVLRKSRPLLDPRLRGDDDENAVRIAPACQAARTKTLPRLHPCPHRMQHWFGIAGRLHRALQHKFKCGFVSD